MYTIDYIISEGRNKELCIASLVIYSSCLYTCMLPRTRMSMSGCTWTCNVWKKMMIFFLLVNIDVDNDDQNNVIASPYQASPSISLHPQAFHIWSPVHLLILNHQIVNPKDSKAIRQINCKNLVFQKEKEIMEI